METGVQSRLLSCYSGCPWNSPEWGLLCVRHHTEERRGSRELGFPDTEGSLGSGRRVPLRKVCFEH